MRVDGLEFGGAGFVTSVGGAHVTSVASANGVAAEYKALTGPRHLQGMATWYLKPRLYKGNFDVFLPGCFSSSLTGKRAIRFHLAHKVSELLGTTADRLEIYGCEEGIAFRLELPETALAAEAASLRA
jgi:phage head maturation protease